MGWTWSGGESKVGAGTSADRQFHAGMTSRCVSIAVWLPGGKGMAFVVRKHLTPGLNGRGIVFFLFAKNAFPRGHNTVVVDAVG